MFTTDQLIPVTRSSAWFEGDVLGARIKLWCMACEVVQRHAAFAAKLAPGQQANAAGVAFRRPDQKIRSARLKYWLPADPTPARVKVKLQHSFSLRTEPRARRRYSTVRPQQSQL